MELRITNEKVHIMEESELPKTHFEIIQDGTTYMLPMYTVAEGEGIKMTGDNVLVEFVRGSNINEDIEKNDGTTHESMLSMLIYDLSYKNELMPLVETEGTLKSLNDALESMQNRKK